MARIDSCAGAEARRDLNSLGSSLYTFSRNYADLRRHLAQMTDQTAGVDLMSLRNHEALDAALREVERLLHNFVTSAMSLVWHTTRLRRGMHRDPSARLHRDPELDTEVARRVRAEFVDDPLAQFVQKLRAYTQKFRLPPPIFSMSWAGEGNPLALSVGLAVSALERWDGWNSQARHFLSQVEDGEVDVAKAVDEYQRRVSSFYAWFDARFRQLYEPELAELAELEWQLATLDLEDKLELASAELRLPVRPRRDDLFVQIFESRDFRELESVPDGPQRGECAIRLLRKHGPVPDHVVQSIRSVYALPG